MGINNSQVCLFGTELSKTMTGSTILIGTLLQNPVILIFDNQAGVAIQIYVNGTDASNLWRTFPAGEALILDLRSQSANASNFTPSIGTAFYGNGANGVFSISFVHAQNM